MVHSTLGHTHLQILYNTLLFDGKNVIYRVSLFIFGKHIVFAFAVCLSVRPYVRPTYCPFVRIQLIRPSQVKLLVGFQQNFTGMVSTLPSCAHHRHVPLRCKRWPQELKIEKNIVRPSPVKLLVGFQPNFTGVINIIFSWAHYRHARLCCTKLEKSCPAFTGQTTVLVGFRPNFTGMMSAIPSCAHHKHVPLRCTKWPPEVKIEKSCPPSQVKLLMGF
jgi:hypothetical protein